MFKDMTIEKYNQVLASKAPTPGGGSGLAVVASTACALCQMAMEVTLTKGENAILEGAISILKRCIAKLYELADEDAKAFDRIIQVSRQVRNGQADKSALQKEYHRAALVPIETMQVCKKALDSTQVVQDFLYKYVATDAYIGIDLLKIVIKNSLHNVYANTNLITDETLKSTLEKQAQEVVDQL